MVEPSARMVVITGVSRGLGRAMTERFIEMGHVVAGCARSESALRELKALYGPPHGFFPVDVADDQAVRCFGDSVLSECACYFGCGSAASFDTAHQAFHQSPTAVVKRASQLAKRGRNIAGNVLSDA